MRRKATFKTHRCSSGLRRSRVADIGASRRFAAEPAWESAFGHTWSRLVLGQRGRLKSSFLPSMAGDNARDLCPMHRNSYDGRAKTAQLQIWHAGTEANLADSTLPDDRIPQPLKVNTTLPRS